MPERVRIEGYAIVSVDGMIADQHGHMPAGLKIDADLRFFSEGLDRAALVVHGRNSHERQPGSCRRWRLIVTRRVPTITRHPRYPRAELWNPAGLSFSEACKANAITSGTAAVTGGTEVFGLFLDFGFDAFHLSRAGKVRIPGGRPVFPQVPTCAPEEVLAEHGLTAGPARVLDAGAEATLVTWQR
jgi:dihydrofolate reductase